MHGAIHSEKPDGESSSKHYSSKIQASDRVPHARILPTILHLKNAMIITSRWPSIMKKHHGYKYQSVEPPNGMCIDMFGPKSFRQSDIRLLQWSRLKSRLAEAQRGNNMQYCSYGDGIFPINSHTICKHVDDTTNDERYENRMMSKIRISNEWAYGKTHNLFPYVKWKFGQKIKRNRFVTRYYFIATLLRNAHTCLYGGITSTYFNCQPPFLEDYFE